MRFAVYPIQVTVWGGPNTLAQALYRLKSTRTEAELQRLIGKLRVYTISDQDDSGPWMCETFPDLFYIVSPGGYGAATWTAIHSVVDGIDNSTIRNDWLARVYAVAPEFTQAQTLHFILELTDRGSPALTRYQRVIVTVQP